MSARDLVTKMAELDSLHRSWNSDLVAWSKRGRSEVVADEQAWTQSKVDETKASELV